MAEFGEEFRCIQFYFITCGTFTYNETQKQRKMLMLSLYLLDIVNTSRTSHASKMLDIVGMYVNTFNEMLVF